MPRTNRYRVRSLSRVARRASCSLPGTVKTNLCPVVPPGTTHQGESPLGSDNVASASAGNSSPGLSLPVPVQAELPSWVTMARRTERPAKRSIRPSRCSSDTGPGKVPMRSARHHEWKSKPSCPIEVVTRTCGQNGVLNSRRTSSGRSGLSS